jgi:hypothetical protein
MPLLSHNGTLTTTVSTWSPERARKEKSSKRPDPPELKPESLKDKKTESSIQRLLNNSVNKDFSLASVQDQASQAELMVIFWKENNSNSMLRKLNQEKNDLYHSYSFYLIFCFHLSQFRYKKFIAGNLILSSILPCLFSAFTSFTPAGSLCFIFVMKFQQLLSLFFLFAFLCFPFLLRVFMLMFFLICFIWAFTCFWQNLALWPCFWVIFPYPLHFFIQLLQFYRCQLIL